MRRPSVDASAGGADVVVERERECCGPDGDGASRELARAHEIDDEEVHGGDEDHAEDEFFVDARADGEDGARSRVGRGVRRRGRRLRARVSR